MRVQALQKFWDFCVALLQAPAEWLSHILPEELRNDRRGVQRVNDAEDADVVRGALSCRTIVTYVGGYSDWGIP